MTEMQVMLDQLRAVPLENAGLIEPLNKHCESLGFRTGSRGEFKLGDLPPAGELPPGAHDAILRAAQEALANGGRYTRAGNLEPRRLNNRVSFEIVAPECNPAGIQSSYLPWDKGIEVDRSEEPRR
jgi:signal transduction histidine kinase